MSDRFQVTLKSTIGLEPLKVALTWFMVLVENVMLILLPLAIGYAIDGVLNHDMQPLIHFALLLLAVVVVSVLRRFYDTRVYGQIRFKLARLVERNLKHAPVSVRSARLTMSRELVDFLEDDLPALMTAVVQLVATVVILAAFHFYLALSVLASGISILIIYSLFHGTFTRLNGALNDQLEQQVTALNSGKFANIRGHFKRLKSCEIKLSDTEAIAYGLIFIVLLSAVLVNLWMVSALVEPSVGQIFSIVTYSLEFVEVAVVLPVTLQTLSRLAEITQRLNVSSEAEAQTPNQQEISYEG
ncbi:ABC transporter six-transmembrane domain-containing protein [Vibrio europaeus]|uniref:ABC transporter six-transmembrane domain-containing protein n=1 Tax=Vibrio europaeus TaxID=300876 RepID=UPI00148CDEE4|nr:ABC transporter six-transmembrane domain-containing protein [Vibrio europaeus]NOH21931.1 ABC transporter permease [Vibrio europaeus]